jgi:hypothetical protein
MYGRGAYMHGICIGIYDWIPTNNYLGTSRVLISAGNSFDRLVIKNRLTEVDTHVASTCAPSLVEWDST